MRKLIPIAAMLALTACGDPPTGYALLRTCPHGPDLWTDNSGHMWVGYSFDHGSFAPVAVGAKLEDVCK